MEKEENKKHPTRTWYTGATNRKLMTCAGIQYPQLLTTVVV